MLSRRKSVSFQLPLDLPGSVPKPKKKAEKEVSIWTIISTGNTEELRKFIQINGTAALNKRSGNFRSPLGLAVYLENPVLVQIMMESTPRPDVNVVDKNGNTPLHEAVERGYFQIAKQLLNTGTCIWDSISSYTMFLLLNWIFTYLIISYNADHLFWHLSITQDLLMTICVEYH
jgi:ankyrin repeat protein